MKLTLTILFAAVIVMSAAAQSSEIEELLDDVGIKPTAMQRGQMDIIGFASTAAQMDQVVSQTVTLARPQADRLSFRYNWNRETSFIAGVCPHDDYEYAGRLYHLLMPHIKAKRVVIFGVFHKARVFNVEDKLIFDSYEAWHGPYGPVQVSALRAEILERLPESDYLVDNDMQMVEHSVEAIVPWLQQFNRSVEIVSILVPYMNWETMDSRASDLASALSTIILENDWNLGEDVAFISSADAVHYGDAGWGGSDFADFGVDVPGYQKAVDRDVSLAEMYLTGPVTADKLRGFLHSCADAEDVKQYKISWCGRFSIPFGLNVASRVVAELEGRPLTGYLLDYGSSVSEASLEVEGIGVTAPNNLHHWVGYAAIGYR
ncbi:AmmeMemoRadiSam system protein B [bacterium]|nr:AmmeMemoRadiSam system protein B [bacterium]MBU1651669.1 AmmeMemoRadiSam system protein B [bacterium]